MARILIACEESQATTKSFRKLGHEAFSCDLLPCSGGHPEWHITYGAMSRVALQKCSNLAQMLLANLLIARVMHSTV